MQPETTRRKQSSDSDVMRRQGCWDSAVRKYTRGKKQQSSGIGDCWRIQEVQKKNGRCARKFPSANRTGWFYSAAFSLLISLISLSKTTPYFVPFIILHFGGVVSWLVGRRCRCSLQLVDLFSAAKKLLTSITAFSHSFSAQPLFHHCLLSHTSCSQHRRRTRCSWLTVLSRWVFIGSGFGPSRCVDSSPPRKSHVTDGFLRTGLAYCPGMSKYFTVLVGWGVNWLWCPTRSCWPAHHFTGWLGESIKRCSTFVMVYLPKRWEVPRSTRIVWLTSLENVGLLVAPETDLFVC